MSWYEAAAYAELRVKRLPTVHHWAALRGGGFAKYIVPYSNFSGEGPDPVGRNDGIGLYDVYDLAGNVAEWCFNEEKPGIRYLRGGAWDDPNYMFMAMDHGHAMDREPGYGFRCAVFQPRTTGGTARFLRGFTGRSTGITCKTEIVRTREQENVPPIDMNPWPQPTVDMSQFSMKTVGAKLIKFCLDLGHHGRCASTVIRQRPGGQPSRQQRQQTGVVNPEFNIDLFGIDARPSATIQVSDYCDGIATSSSDTLIETKIITPSTSLGNRSVANQNLLNFVKSLYNPDGTPISTFATFRVNPDKDFPSGSSPIRGYFLALAENSNSAFRPRLYLTITTE